MSGRKIIRDLSRAAIASFTAIVAIIVAPGVARADSNVPQSGSTYSSANEWYTSANVRMLSVEHGGYVWLNMDVTPKLQNNTPDFIKWRIYQSEMDQSPITALNQDPAAWVNLGYIGWPGEFFRNKFARGTTCDNCNHNFSGNEDY